MGKKVCCDKKGLSRGAWSAEEDRILMNYVHLHGQGKWRELPKRAGLNRCGKSCRLRWLNYLRPDIKRGNISSDEEDLIIRLHRLLGNRWSLIAGRLPGRTDNEIKNYWNTNLSKRIAQKHSHNNDKPTDPTAGPGKRKGRTENPVGNDCTGSQPSSVIIRPEAVRCTKVTVQTKAENNNSVTTLQNLCALSTDSTPQDDDHHNNFSEGFLTVTDFDISDLLILDEPEIKEQCGHDLWDFHSKVNGCVEIPKHFGDYSTGDAGSENRDLEDFFQPDPTGILFFP